jgi:hypothetical protein
LSYEKRYKLTMKKLFFTAIAASTLLAITSAACTPPALEPEASEAELSEQPTAEQPTDETPEMAANEAEANLLTYDGPAQGIPVKAQYPDTMTVQGSGSGEGVGVFFTFEPQGNALDEAEVHVFLPSGAASTTDLMPMITGDQGLIANNGWTLDGSRADGVEEFPYAWFEMVFDFSTDKEQSGHILIGQTNGQAVQVILLYPAEMADAYWPTAKTVLDSLEFDPGLLPITSSES